MNESPAINIFYKRTIHRLNGKEILVIPAIGAFIGNTCQKGLNKLQKSRVISIPECSIKIDHREYTKETTSDFQFVLDLPNFSYIDQRREAPKIQVDEGNLDELNETKKILDSVQSHSRTCTNIPLDYVSINPTKVIS